MPLYRNLRPDENIVLPDIAGPYGESRVAGLQMHRFTYDMADQPSLTDVTGIRIFEPDSSLLPLVIFHVMVRWSFATTASDSTRIEIGGQGSGIALINSASFATQATSGTVWGSDPQVLNTGTNLRVAQGNNLHNHFTRSVSTVSGSDPPLEMRVDTTPASAGPYEGKIYVFILFASLT